MPPDVIRDGYATSLRKLAGGAARAAYAPLLARLPELVAAARAERGDAAEVAIERFRQDASGLSASAAVREAEQGMRSSLRARAQPAAVRAAADVNDHNRVQLGRQVKAVVGIDLAGSAKLKSIIEGFVRDNVARITGLSEKLAREVEELVLDGLAKGRLHESLAKDIQARLGVTESRAQLIAVDQVGKLNGELNAQRQRDLGVTHFYWRSSEDARVRGNPSGKYPDADPSHYARNGHRFAYADPPKGRNGERELPGTPIRCRCTAEPDLEDLRAREAENDNGVENTLAPPLDPDVEAEAMAQLAALEGGGPVAAFDAAAVSRAIEAARAAASPEPPAPPPSGSPPSSTPALTPGADRAGLGQLVNLLRLQPPPPPDTAARAPALAPEALTGRAAAEAHEQEPAVRHIADGAVENKRSLGGGMNDSFRVTVRADDGTTVDAAWKPLAGAKPRNWPCPNVDWKKTPEREQAASIVAEQLGVRDLMPVATVREVDGKRGSVQAFAEGTTEFPTGPVNAEAMQRMRVYDFIVGNRDRHQKNVVWRGGTPVLIDHGLSFPSGPPDRFIQPVSRVLWELPAGPISQEVVEFVHRIDEPGLAASLHAAGIDAKAITHTLYRLRVLKANPQGLASTGRYIQDDKRAWTKLATQAESSLSEDDRNEVGSVVRSARKRKR
jgi:SPP1 gp7 family putative phage head morphogenesis protein